MSRLLRAERDVSARGGWTTPAVVFVGDGYIRGVSELPERLRERLDRVPGRVLLDYLGERLGAARTEAAVSRALAGEDAPPATRRIAEQLFVAMDATVGNWKVTLLAS